MCKRIGSRMGTDKGEQGGTMNPKLNKLMAGIDTNLFFKCGMFLFGVIGICNTYNYIAHFPAMNLASRVSGIASLLFNFITVGFFYFMYNSMKTDNTYKETSTDDAEEALKDISMSDSR